MVQLIEIKGSPPKCSFLQLDNFFRPLFVEIMIKVLKKPLVLPNVPKVMMELLLGEMSYLLFASQRVSSKRIEKKGFSFEFRNICHALESFYDGEACSEKSMESSYEKNYS